jgi:murein DD-endopeptidase MepM/ murein hydrolase activator NlpD
MTNFGAGIRMGAVAAFACFAPSSQAVQFVTPLGGAAYRDWTIVNYVDNTPGPGVSDYLGGIYTYDGHNAIDFTLPNFRAMDRGIPVFAAAGGTVLRIHDGEFDRCSWANPCGDHPNYIVIDHGDGVVAEYLHLAKGSIDVAVGQTVSAGEQIGLVGSSGLSTNPHLHFAVFENGQLVDTFQDPSRWWVTPLPYAGDMRGVLDSGVTDHFPTPAEWNEGAPEVRTFLAGTEHSVNMWVNFFGTDNGDRIEFVWKRPDGSQYANWWWSVPEYTFAIWDGATTIPADAPLGDWRVEFRINDQIFATSTFAVAAAVPEPATYALVVSGLCVVGAIARRKA